MFHRLTSSTLLVHSMASSRRSKTAAVIKSVIKRYLINIHSVPP
ncbi:MAG TPA: hypothetical protein VEL70_07330 [Candidatus Acidoferrum sp.]|nr:hypothetical protein [Candidatus Acidoferrum sp.]